MSQFPFIWENLFYGMTLNLTHSKDVLFCSRGNNHYFSTRVTHILASLETSLGKMPHGIPVYPSKGLHDGSITALVIKSQQIKCNVYLSIKCGYIFAKVYMCEKQLLSWPVWFNHLYMLGYRKWSLLNIKKEENFRKS